VDPHKPSGKANQNPGGPEGELAQNPSVDEFFSRLSYDMRHPKPGQEGITAALQAIQRLALEVDSEEAVASEASAEAPREGRSCQVCGAQNRPQHRYCATCGVALEEAPQRETLALSAPSEIELGAPPVPNSSLPPGQHHYHHHYHHHYFNGEGSGSAGEARQASPAVRETRRASLTGPSLSRSEAAVRKLTQDLAQACNTKQLDDLVSMYGPDAIVLRPNFPIVRGSAAIREFFFAALDGGLGEVEMEPLRVEVFGDVGYESGRCKMLVPIAMGKRREERGKYLIVSARQTSGGEWKALADCWSSDLNLNVASDPATTNPTTRPPNKRS
jgi:ketosteroid isomerase-like protein